MEKQSLPTQEVCGSNPIIVKVLLNILTIKCIEKTKIKKKEAGNGQLKKREKNGCLNDLEMNLKENHPLQGIRGGRLTSCMSVPTKMY